MFNTARTRYTRDTSYIARRAIMNRSKLTTQVKPSSYLTDTVKVNTSQEVN